MPQTLTTARRALLTLCALLLPAALCAQDLPLITPDVTRIDGDGLIIATCNSGEGCHCYISNHSLTTLETQLPLSPPEGVDNPVLVRLDGQLLWSAESGHAVDLVYGGDGQCDPQPFDANETGLPRNGLWVMTLTKHQIAGCPKEVATAIAGETIIGQSERRSIAWPRPFSMSPLTADNPVAGPWANLGGGVWRNSMVQASGPTGGNASVILTARIVSQNEITLQGTFSTDALAILTGETCVSTTHSTLRRMG